MWMESLNLPSFREVIPIKTEEIIKLIEAIKNSDFSEFTVENEGFRISLSRGRPAEMEITTTPGPENKTKQESTEQETAPEIKTDKNLIEVNAPMVGTFYRAPSPEDEPFVGVGDLVKPEDTLCILEAMKLMNEIKAEQSGEIAENLVENGEMVEYGQPLFRIKVKS